MYVRPSCSLSRSSSEGIVIAAAERFWNEMLTRSSGVGKVTGVVDSSPYCTALNTTCKER